MSVYETGVLHQQGHWCKTFWNKQKLEKVEEGIFSFFDECFIKERIELLLTLNICKVEKRVIESNFGRQKY